MYFAQASLVLAGISAVASAAFLENGKRDTGLEVTLTAAEGSAADVVATVKNVGTQSLNLLTLGTFLDSAPVQKLAVVDEASMLTTILLLENRL
jgi:deuterolysin